MTASAVEAVAGKPRVNWTLAAGFAVLAVPTLVRFAQQSWGEESGAQAPIVLATGGWLLWRNWPRLVSEGAQGQWWLTTLALLVALPTYVFGRAYSFAVLEAVGLYGAGVAMLHHVFGLRALLRQWFPLLFIGFAIPLPAWILDTVTAPLKEFVSLVATRTLQIAGLPVEHYGVTITVAQYQLLVEDACSGLNSLFGLIAIGLLYAYLARGGALWRSLALLAFIVPIAIFANVIRVILIVLLTYFAGNEVAQSFIHYLAGFMLFGLSLGLVFAIHQALEKIAAMRRPHAAA